MQQWPDKYTLGFDFEEIEDKTTPGLLYFGMLDDEWMVSVSLSDYASHATVEFHRPRPGEPLKDRWYREPIHHFVWQHDPFDVLMLKTSILSEFDKAKNKYLYGKTS